VSGMLLRNPRYTRKTLLFWLIAWYCGLFTVSSIALFGAAYALLSSSMQRRDQDAIRSHLKDLAAEYSREGIRAVEKTIEIEESQSSGKAPFVVRISRPGTNTVFLHVPRRWARLDLEQLKRDTGSTKPWVHIRVKDLDDDDDDDEIVEVASRRFPDSATLQVGASTDDREDVLERFGHISLGIIFGLVFIGLGGGAFLATRALRPFRGLLESLRDIVATGDLAARIPVAGGGDELDALSVLFNGLLGKIGVLIDGMQSSLDHVAHDLRTPMTRLRGMAEMALQSEDEDSLREALVNCVEESDRILAMLNTLMDISEAETGTMRLNLEEINVLKLLEQIVELYSYVAEDKHIAISLSAPEDLFIAADRNRMTQVVANLVDNAIKYTAEGGKIDIAARSNRSEVAITVADTGVGIAENERRRIWERLYRSDKSRSQRGLGLGLSLVKAIVQAHGGRTEVASEVGRGSRFALYIPAHDG
jgi:signal transduction histidine kinase